MIPTQAATKGWTRPVSRPEFFVPGVTLIMLGVAFMTAAVLLRSTQVFEDGLFPGGAFAVVTGILVVRRTRLGTALFGLLLIGAAVARVSTGSLATSLTGWLNDLLGLSVFVSAAIHLVRQIASHRARKD